MARLIQDEIKRPLADAMLFGALKEGGRTNVDVVDGRLTFTYTPLKAPAPPVADPV
jgi:ATP-dependent Clp protease ATP-binding subunit ClpA